MLVHLRYYDEYQKASFSIMIKKEVPQFSSLNWDKVTRTPSVAGAGSDLYPTTTQHQLEIEFLISYRLRKTLV
jgi:hypothetical protein